MFSFRTLGIAAVALISLAAAHPASAQTTLLSDTFNSENGGAGQLSYTNFANFNVTQNDVDLIGNGFYDAIPGNGLYVDLSGAANGAIQSKTDFMLTPGTYELQFDLANPDRGSQYNSAGNSTTVTVGNVYSQTFQIPVAEKFTTFTEDFTVSSATSGFLTFAENHNTPAGDYLDNVSLTQTSPAAVPEASTTVSLGLLLMLGLGGMAIAAKRKQSAAQA
jgi:hypothetical protein